MTARIELSALDPGYDLIVVGGGITGAGVFREAARSGARVLLVEARDYASGTSSRSSKLVHGGLRYLKNGQWRLTLESVRERERLLDEAPGLVEPQTFLMPIYAGRKPGRWLMQFGLRVYDWMAGARRSRWLDAPAARAAEANLADDGLLGAMVYEDARTDDARLVLRLIFDACADGGTALNYVAATLRSENGRVCGVRLRDAVSGCERDIEAGMVVNATGAWAAALPGAPAAAPKLRPLRGSHLLFSPRRFALRHAVSWLHPQDQRPVFAYPWEGAVICGTTDLDHREALDTPRMTPAERDYLLAGLAAQFPSLKLGAGDVISTYAGVRPVVDGGKDDPSAESRESALWRAPGLIGITGGKLTTFRVTAHEVLRAAATERPRLAPESARPLFASATPVASQRRLYGRLGAAAAGALLQQVPGEDLRTIGETPWTWAELRWAARHEQVVHLDDLLLRRTRLGLVIEEGARALLPQVLAICREELGWDAQRCASEEQRYLACWRAQHAPLAA
ncbi:glycerol-3-phosphate dehydrogenase/oxidase [Sinimarinibacterium thermocellulolyticum]|uniref:Glycerol-3-phosphate dehydrogenase/oxidase n=1 Tax=Sinimarinibacterium thermocellulolyticum TaxID=3170016 RepID=A0ABV2AA55_9GAMM